MDTLSPVDMLAALHDALQATPARTIVPALDEQAIAYQMRLEQQAEARKDERLWGRNEIADWAGASW